MINITTIGTSVHYICCWIIYIPPYKHGVGASQTDSSSTTANSLVPVLLSGCGSWSDDYQIAQNLFA